MAGLQLGPSEMISLSVEPLLNFGSAAVIRMLLIKIQKMTSWHRFVNFVSVCLSRWMWQIGEISVSRKTNNCTSVQLVIFLSLGLGVDIKEIASIYTIVHEDLTSALLNVLSNECHKLAYFCVSTVTVHFSILNEHFLPIFLTVKMLSRQLVCNVITIGEWKVD